MKGFEKEQNLELRVKYLYFYPVCKAADVEGSLGKLRFTYDL